MANGTWLQELPLVELAGQKGEMLSVDTNISVKDGMKMLADNDILSLPILDAEQKLLGVVSINDIVTYIAYGVVKGDANIPETGAIEQKRLSVPLADLLGTTVEGQSDWASASYKSDAKVGDVLRPFGLGVHRVVVESPNGYRLISQTDVVRYMYNNIDKCDTSILDAKIADVIPNAVAGTALTMPSTESALSGFRKMVVHDVPAVAVVDPNGIVVANFSASDLRGLRPSQLEEVHNNVLDFIRARHDRATKVLAEVDTISGANTVREAMTRILEGHIHRLWAVDGNKKPLGVVSITDILRLVMPNGFKGPEDA